MVTHSKKPRKSFLPPSLEGIAPADSACGYCGRNVLFEEYIVMEIDEEPALIECRGSCDCGHKVVSIGGTRPDLIADYYSHFKQGKEFV